MEVFLSSRFCFFFVCDNWVYASTGCSGVDDYWMRIPILLLIVPMKELIFDSWRRVGEPIAGWQLPKFRELMNLSTPLQEFLNKNLLIIVPVDCATKSTRPGSATLISGSLYSLLVQYVESNEEEPGFSVKSYDALLALRQFADEEPEDSAPVPELDYLVYFLTATLQEFNPEAKGLELLC